MAIITTIQGTDSLSASRVTLNDNFTAINSELAAVTTLLDPATGNLLNVVDAEVETLLVDGGNAAEFATTGNTLTADTDVDGAVSFNGKVAYTVTAASTLPAANSFAGTIYVIDSATAANPVILNVGDNGQEIMLVADGGSVTISAANVAGTTSISIAQYGTLTLRFVSSAWYIVSSYKATIA